MQRVEAALRKTRIGPTIGEHLDRIKNWKPKDDNDSILRDGVVYRYDGSNINMDLKVRMTFQLIKVELATRRNIRTLLSDGENQVRCEFFPKAHELTHSKRLSPEEESRFIQLSKFTIVISVDKLPLILTAQDFTLVEDVGAVTRRPGGSTLVEERPEIIDQIDHLIGNIPPRNHFYEEEDLQFFSQPSSTHRALQMKRVSSRNIERSDSDSSAVNFARADVSSQLPFDRRPLVDPKAAQIRKASSNLMMLLQQSKRKETFPGASCGPSKNTNGSRAHPTTSSTTTTSQSNSLGLSSSPRRNLKSTFRQLQTESQPATRLGPNVDKGRNSSTGGDAGRPVKRSNTGDVIIKRMPKTAHYVDLGDPLQSGNLTKKTSNYLPRGDFVIAKDQGALIDSEEAWFPPRPGNRAPTARVPIELFKLFNEMAHQCAGVGSSSEADLATSHNESEAAASQVESEEPQSDSEHEQVQPYPKQIARPTENIVEGDDSDTTSTASWEPTPPLRTRKPDLPPDSSAEELLPSINAMKTGTQVVTDNQRVNDTEQPNGKIFGFGSQQTIVVDMEEEESDLDVSVPDALSQSAGPHPSESIPAFEEVVENTSVFVKRTPAGRGGTILSVDDSVKMPASFPVTGNALDIAPLDTSPSLGGHGYGHPLIANPVQNILAFAQEKHGPLRPTSRQKQPDGGDDESGALDIAGTNAVEANEVILEGTTNELSPTLEDEPSATNSYPGLNIRVSQQDTFPQQSPPEMGAVPSLVDVSSEDEGPGKRKDDLESAVDGIYDVVKMLGQTDEDDVNSELIDASSSRGTQADQVIEDRVSINEQDQRSSRTSSLSPLDSDEFEDMLQTQLRSDMERYSSQDPQLSLARSHTRDGVERLTTSIQVPASSPQSSSSVRNTPSEVFAEAEHADDLHVQQESPEVLRSVEKRRSNEHSEPNDLGSNTTEHRTPREYIPSIGGRWEGHSFATGDPKPRKSGREQSSDWIAAREEQVPEHSLIEPFAQSYQKSANTTTRNITSTGCEEPNSLSSSRSNFSCLSHAVVPHPTDLDHLEALAQNSFEAPIARSMERDVSVSGFSKPAAPQDFVDMIYLRFKTEYSPDYDGELGHFRALCKKIKVLRETRNLAPHQSMWDDFIIRHRHEYRMYMSNCADVAEYPDPYEDFYHEHIARPEFTKGIITPAVLLDLLGAESNSSVVTALSLSRPLSSGRPSFQQQPSNSERGSSLPHVMPVQRGGSELINRRMNMSQCSSLNPSGVPARGPHEICQAVPQQVTPNAVQGVSDAHLKCRSDRQKAMGEKSRGFTHSTTSVDQVSRPISAAGVNERAAAPIHETKSEEQIDLTQSSPSRIERAERTPSPTTTVNKWLSNSKSPAHSAFQVKPTSRDTSLADKGTGSISPPPHRNPLKRRSLPWAKHAAQSKQTTLHQGLPIEQPCSTPQVASSRSINIPGPGPVIADRVKRKREVISTVEMDQAPLHKSPKPNPDENESNLSWHKDPNTPFNLYERGYSSLRSERERNSLGRKSRAKLMTGGVNVLGWMK